MKKIRIVLLALLGVALAAALFFTVRQVWANQQVARAPLAATSRLEIIPLYEEASTGDEFISGHGVAYLIRTDTSCTTWIVLKTPAKHV